MHARAPAIALSPLAPPTSQMLADASGRPLGVACSIGEAGLEHMALSMGIGAEWSEGFGGCDSPDVSEFGDTESEAGEELAFAPAAFERAVVAGCSKRTYGVFRDGGASVEPRKRSRVDEQLELLRAAIPNLCASEKGSILVGAYEYIERLQRQVQELQSELDLEEGCSEEGVGSWEDGREGERLADSDVVPEASHAECRAGLDATVEVIRTDEGLRIHIQCVKRPRVLADIMELLESSGLSVEQVSIDYQEDSRLVFDYVGSEVDGQGIVADSRHVEACLRSLIVEEREIASS